jgi:hypothetical protein
MSHFKSCDKKHTINSLTLVLDNYIQWRTGLTFSTPIKANGKISNWWKICCLVWANEQYNKDGISRSDIVTFLFNKPPCVWHGWYSNVFAALNESELLHYDPKTKLWNTGKRFEAYRLTLLETCETQLSIPAREHSVEILRSKVDA